MTDVDALGAADAHPARERVVHVAEEGVPGCVRLITSSSAVEPVSMRRACTS